MLENELDLGIRHTGYRLVHFQLFNWGTFSDYIVNLDLAGENTLLTGANGSGKTTLVDGLLTLLVPREYRSYNLSGGQDGKEGRSEESYVLGAYSTTKSELDYSVNKEYLRDKSCHSIILGQFDNANSEYPLTLLQIRYFNQNGVLQRYFILCEGALDLQAMNERGVAFDATPGWKKRMLAAFSSYKLFFFDTFKAYSIEFASRVGFRDREKALRIFSQTVGMKDLSNLNEFIRTRMLSEMDIESEFKKTLANFETLIGTKKLIEKEEEQILQLRAMEKEAQEFRQLDTKLVGLKVERQTLPLWEGLKAMQFLDQEIRQREREHEQLQTQLSENKRESGRVEEILEDLKRTLSSDKRVEREGELKRQREWLSNGLATTQASRHTYETLAKTLRLSVPRDSSAFIQNLAHIQSMQEKIRARVDSLEDERTDQANELAKCNQELQNLKAQLQAMGNRESNIPYKYLLARERLCKELGLQEKEVPFLGELIQLRQDCLEYETGVNGMLCSLALTLLVHPYHLESIVSYLWEHPLELPLEIRRIEEKQINQTAQKKEKEPRIADDDEQVYFDDTNTPNRLDLMLETRPDYPYGDFIRTLLEQEIPYYLSTNPLELLETDNSFGSCSLLHAKGYFHKGATGTAEWQVLGWDAQKKRTRLQQRIQQLSDLKQEIEGILEDLRRESKLLADKNAAADRILEFKQFREIDTDSLEDQRNILDDQLIALRNEMNDLSALQEQAHQTKLLLDTLSSEKEQLTLHLGSNNKEKELEIRDRKTYSDQLSSFDLAQYQDYIEGLASRNSLPSTFGSLEQIKKIRRELQVKLDTHIEELSNSYDQARKKVENLMDRFVHPGAKLLQTYPTWTSDVSDLRPDIEVLDMFLALQHRLEAEDLPRFKKRFENMRSRQMKSDIINFNVALRQWERHIRENIAELNESLSSIVYQQQPQTRIKLTLEKVKDTQIRQFNTLLGAAIPDAGVHLQGNDKNQEVADNRFFEATKTLLEALKTDELFCKKVLDVRRWFVFAVEEYDPLSKKQVRYYQDSAGISGGQKAKLAYTILAAAIAHQFDVFNSLNVSRSFRFVIVDEAFSKSDDENSRYAMDLFKNMDLQLMVVTPKDKINLVEPYINSVQITTCNDGQHSYVHSLTKETFKEELSRQQ